jgi:predicted phosphoribosyltransferase
MPVHEQPELRDRVGVFRDRIHAGEVVAGMLAGFRGGEAMVLAIPAGGLPVGAAVASALALPLDVAVVSKITLPWNTEVGYGAVAFDGTVRINEELVRGVGLGEEEIRRGVEETLAKVRRRVAALRGAEGAPDLSGRSVIVVDDGLASGFTMRTALEALREAGASCIVVAVPTGSLRCVEELASRADALYCANVRAGRSFAVADAYQRWYDVDEGEAREILGRLGHTPRASG